jgi:transcriptional regulator with XRE-family HTH domain
MILLRSYLGAELRRLRLSKSMSLRDVASSANISLGYVSEVERGLKEPSSEILFSMCRALDVPMSSVLLEVSSKFLIEELEQLLESSHLETI